MWFYIYRALKTHQSALAYSILVDPEKNAEIYKVLVPIY